MKYSEIKHSTFVGGGRFEARRTGIGAGLAVACWTLRRRTRLYEDLRQRLLDLSKRNQLLNYRLSARSKKYVQIVDVSLEAVHGSLVSEETSLRIKPLPEPDEIPREERTDEFRAAFDHARLTDIEYLAELEALEATGRTDELEIAKIEKKLRNRVRERLGLPPRPSRKEINRIEHARSLGIDPNVELSSPRKSSGDRDLPDSQVPG